jgi:hypothetical protein
MEEYAMSGKEEGPLSRRRRGLFVEECWEQVRVSTNLIGSFPCLILVFSEAFGEAVQGRQ